MDIGLDASDGSGGFQPSFDRIEIHTLRAQKPTLLFDDRIVNLAGLPKSNCQGVLVPRRRRDRTAWHLVADILSTVDDTQYTVLGE